MVLRNLILQTPQGIPVFGRSLACHIGTYCMDLSQDSTFESDTILKSGLLTAMLTYNEAKRDSFHELELTDSKIISLPTEHLIGIFEVDPEDNIGDLEQRLKVMVELFETNYKYELDNFQGDIGLFEEFEKILEDNGILEQGEKFKKNCLECKYSKKCTFRVTTGPFYLTILEKFDSIPDISTLYKLLLMMLGMPKQMFSR